MEPGDPARAPGGAGVVRHHQDRLALREELTELPWDEYPSEFEYEPEDLLTLYGALSAL